MLPVLQLSTVFLNKYCKQTRLVITTGLGIPNEQPSQEARLRGGSFIESCEGEKFSNSCNSGVTFMSVTL